MKIGISSWTFPWAIGVRNYPSPSRPLNVLGLLDLAVELRVQVVQIADNLPIEGLPSDEIARVAEHQTRLGLTIELGTCGVDPQHLHRYLEYALALNAPLVRTLTNAPGLSNRTLREVAACLQQIAREYEKARVVLAIENYEAHASGAFLDVIEQVASPFVGICLDTTNSLGALEPPSAVVAAMRRQTRNVHIKDFSIRRVPHKMGFEVSGAPAGSGCLDIPAILESVRTAGWDPNVILEQWPPWQGCIETTVRQERQWAEQGIEYLRKALAGVGVRRAASPYNEIDAIQSAAEAGVAR